MIGAEGRLAAFGQPRQVLAPAFLHGEAAAGMGIQRLAPDPRDLLDIGRAALPPLDLHRGDAHFGQLRNQVDGVETGRLFQRVEALAVDQEASREEDKAKIEIRYRTIVRTVTEFIDRPVYMNTCLDQDGVDAINGVAK